MARGRGKDAHGRANLRQEPGPATPPRFFEMLRALADHKAEFVLIGGFAVTLHGYVRTTKDIDVVPDSSLENMTRLWETLAELKARPVELDEFAATELPVPFTAEGFASGDGDWALYTTCGRIDVMRCVETADGEIRYDELRKRAERVDLDELDGKPLYVASTGDLIAMKEHAGRDIDRIDVTALRMAQGDEE